MQTESPTICRGVEDQSGAVAVEFGLLLPLLLMVIIGVLTIGHGLGVRHVLSSAAYDAARVCVLARTPTAACSLATVQDRVNKAGGKNWCSPMNVTVQNSNAPGYPAVRQLAVNVNCGYRGIFASSFATTEAGLVIKQVRTRAVMPY